MTFTFEKPVGAVVDVKELQYIASLLQTSPGDSIRDASVDATDIRHFLMSRYGVQVDEEIIKKKIMYDMAGSESDDESFDIPEIVSILLIPFLKKISSSDLPQDEGKEGTTISKIEQEALQKKELLLSVDMQNVNANIIKNVLEILLQDATGSVEPQPLTKDLLIKIFEKCQEEELSKDDNLLSEMIAVASGELNDGAVLDTETFKRVLTSDLESYNEHLEHRFTTHFEDVFGSGSIKKVDESKKAKKEESNQEEMSDDKAGESRSKENEESENEMDSEHFKKVFHFSAIDYQADTFRRRAHYLFAWMAAIFGYLTYFPKVTRTVSLCSPENADMFGCKVANSIVIWFRILFRMIYQICLPLILISLGNHMHRDNPLEILLSLAAIIGLIFCAPLINDRSDMVFAEYYSELIVVNYIIGSVLLIIHLCNIVRRFIPEKMLNKNKLLTIIFRGSGVRNEFGIKQAAIKKVQKLVKNAYDLNHGSGDKSQSTSLLNYMRLAEEREVGGGFLWAWKLFISGNVYDEEGIWMHTRLMTGNLAQLLMIVGAFVYMFNLSSNSIETSYSNTLQNPCDSFVDIDKCTFPSFSNDGDDTMIGVGFCDDVVVNNETCIEEFGAAPSFLQNILCLYRSAASNTTFSSCPQLYSPLNTTIITAFNGSTAENYCSSPITACTEFDDEYKATCVIGVNKVLMPFDFQGDLCENFTLGKEDFEEVLNQLSENLQFQSYVTPAKSAVIIAVIAGLIFSIFAGVFYFSFNIPSQIITIMKFRSGAIESLHGKKFLKYRRKLFETTVLTGAYIWGMVLVCVSVFLFVTLVVFFFTYHVTRQYAEVIAAAFIGVFVTLMVKFLITSSLDKYSFSDGFYRERPVIANLTSVTLEGWNLATTSAFMISRAIQIMVIVAVNVGRFDRPILSRDLDEIGSGVVDKYPLYFFQDLLSTDAHRHPYIERLGMMFLMKLKHPNFAKRAGSMWRLLFVMALMPYVRKNRIVAMHSEN